MYLVIEAEEGAERETEAYPLDPSVGFGEAKQKAESYNATGNLVLHGPPPLTGADIPRLYPL